MNTCFDALPAPRAAGRREGDGAAGTGKLI